MTKEELRTYNREYGRRRRQNPESQEKMREANRRHYQKYTEHYRAVARARAPHREVVLAQRRAIFRWWLSRFYCACCGAREDLCLHHIDPATKICGCGNTTFMANFQRWVREVEKCVVLCRGCHTALHAALRRNHVCLGH